MNRHKHQQIELPDETTKIEQQVMTSQTSNSGSRTTGRTSSPTTSASTSSAQLLLRHDEQANEDYYDKRNKANNDIEKGRLHFPPMSHLYGRSKELKRLHNIYKRLRIDDDDSNNNPTVTATATATPFTKKTTIKRRQRSRSRSTGSGSSANNNNHSSTNNSMFGATSTTRLYGKSSQIVFMGGYSGVGKSTLVTEFVRQLQTNPPPSLALQGLGSPKLILGKYEKLNNFPGATSTNNNHDAPSSGSSSNTTTTNAPFSAIAQGLNDFCSELLQHHQTRVKDEKDRRSMMEQLQSHIREAVGDTNIPVLIEIVPSISKLLRDILHDDDGISTLPKPVEDNKSMIKTQQIFCNLIKAVCNFFSYNTKRDESWTDGSIKDDNHQQKLFEKQLQQPIIMFLDDIQWIDDGSLTLLEALLVDTSISNFMFIGAFRSNEVDNKDEVNTRTSSSDQGRHLHGVNHLLEVVKKHRGGSTTAIGVDENSHNEFDKEETKTYIEYETKLDDKDDRTAIRNESRIARRGRGKTRDDSIGGVEQIDIADLTMEDIGQFIADTLGYDADSDTNSDGHIGEDGHKFTRASTTAVGECQPLTQAIYQKTLGNIFYTKQALEELVRRNGLYYDLMMFRWEWNISKIKEEQLLSNDVVDMVQNKIRHYLPKSLQQLLTIASLTRSSFPLDLVHKIYQKVGASDTGKEPLTTETVIKLLNQAVSEGLLVHVTARHRQNSQTKLINERGSFEYAFAHDRIQEAASSFVTGEARESLCYRIAMELLQQLEVVKSNQNNKVKDQNEKGIYEYDNDWMLFTAIRHLNSIPLHFLQHQFCGGSLREAKVKLAKWNLRAAKLSIDKSAFTQAVELLRAGVSHTASTETINSELQDESQKSDSIAHAWKTYYSLCLGLYNHLLETEFCLGNHDLAQQAVNVILQNARRNSDKCLAHHYDITIITLTNSRNYDEAAARGVQYLASHGIQLPTDPGDAFIMKERFRLRIVQGRRKLSDLLNQTDGSLSPSLNEHNEAIMRILDHVTRCAVYHSNRRLATVCFLAAQRLSFRHGLSQYLPAILSQYALLLRQRGKIDEAFNVGSAAFDMLNKLNQRGPSWVRGMNACSGCILPLRLPVARSVEVFLNTHRFGLACGDVEWAILGAMQYSLCYFCAGYPVNALFEPKLILFEEEARRYSQPTSVIVTFGIFRQFLLNLQGKGNPNPAILEGIAAHEDTILAGFEGSTHKQTLRDISIFRLVLACIFGDDKVSQEMLNRLAEYPDFDFPLAREHLRDVFMGIEALRLARRFGHQHQDYKKLTLLGRQKMKIFQRLSKHGSRNARVFLQCLRAEDRPSKERYDTAIKACTNSSFLHLEALMNEHCGMYLLDGKGEKKKNDIDDAESYLTQAMFLYFDWGALGKVNQLRLRYNFLKGAKRSADSTSLFMKYMSSSHTSDDTMRSLTST